MNRSGIAGRGATRGTYGAEPAEVLLTVPEVAARLRVCERTVRRLLSRGELPFIPIGRSIRVKPSELAAYLRAASLR